MKKSKKEVVHGASCATGKPGGSTCTCQGKVAYKSILLDELFDASTKEEYLEMVRLHAEMMWKNTLTTDPHGSKKLKKSRFSFDTMRPFRNFPIIPANIVPANEDDTIDENPYIPSSDPLIDSTQRLQPEPENTSVTITPIPPSPRAWNLMQQDPLENRINQYRLEQIPGTNDALLYTRYEGEVSSMEVRRIDIEAASFGSPLRRAYQGYVDNFGDPFASPAPPDSAYIIRNYCYHAGDGTDHNLSSRRHPTHNNRLQYRISTDGGEFVNTSYVSLGDINTTENGSALRRAYAGYVERHGNPFEGYSSGPFPENDLSVPMTSEMLIEAATGGVSSATSTDPVNYLSPVGINEAP